MTAYREDGAPDGEGLAGALERLRWGMRERPDSPVTPDVALVLAELERLHVEVETLKAQAVRDIDEAIARVRGGIL